MLLPKRFGEALTGSVVPVDLNVGDMVETEVGSGGWVVCTLEVEPVAEGCSNADPVAAICC